MQCSWCKEGRFAGKDGHFLGTLRSTTSYNCPRLFLGFLETTPFCVIRPFPRQWRQMVVEVVGLGQGSPGTQMPCVSLCSDRPSAPLPAVASELVPRITAFEASLPHLLWCVYLSHPCFKQLFFLMPYPHHSLCPEGI